MRDFLCHVWWQELVPDLLTETPSDQMLHLHIEGSQHSPGWQQQNNFPSCWWWWAWLMLAPVRVRLVLLLPHSSTNRSQVTLTPHTHTHTHWPFCTTALFTAGTKSLRDVSINNLKNGETRSCIFFRKRFTLVLICKSQRSIPWIWTSKVDKLYDEGTET